MAMKMDEFLSTFFSTLHFSKMPQEQFSRYCDYVKADDMSGNMKSWKSLLETDAAGNLVTDALGYKRKEVPNPSDATNGLEPEEWKKLFKVFEKTFRKMYANYDNLSDDGKKFLDAYFGGNHIFQPIEVSDRAQTQIDQLYDLLSKHRSDFEVPLERAGLLNDKLNYDGLLKKIESKAYKKDPDFKQILATTAKSIQYTIKESTHEENADKNLVRRLGLPGVPDYSAITDDTKFEGKNYLEDTHIEAFKENAVEMLEELYNNGKKMDSFSQYDRGAISGPLKKAKDNMQYNDPNSKDYLPPKREDELTIAEKVSKWWGKTYSENLEKYTELKGNRVYFSPQAKRICEAIDKEKIKPTDGLAKILESADKIKGRFKDESKKTTDHFDWMIKTLKELNSDGNMKKAFEGALSHGWQMKKIVEAVIIKALESNPPKKDEAKTTLEMLSVMRYGLTTSKIMDTFNKSDFSIFSDKNLSWNKNSAVQFVTSALDKTLKFAFKTIGYTITVAGNAINSRNRRFNGNTDQLDAMIERESAKNQAKKDRLDKQIRGYDTQISNLEHQTDDRARAQRDIASMQMNRFSGEIDALKREYENLGIDSRTGEVSTKKLIELKEQQDSLKETLAYVMDLNDNIAELEREITARSTTAEPIDELEAKLNLMKQQLNHITEGNPNFITEKTAEADQLYNDYNAEFARYNTAIQRHKEIPIELEAKQEKLDYYQSKVTKFKQATDTLERMKEEKLSLQNTLDTMGDAQKSDFKELMGFWDFLEQGGRDLHMNSMYKWTPRSKKTHQSNFDSEKEAMLAQYMASHGYAA